MNKSWNIFFSDTYLIHEQFRRPVLFIKFGIKTAHGIRYIFVKKMSKFLFMRLWGRPEGEETNIRETKYVLIQPFVLMQTMICCHA